MFCSKCGVQLPDGSAFCSSCGQSLQTRVKISPNQRTAPAPQPTSRPIPAAQPIPAPQPAPVTPSIPEPIAPKPVIPSRPAPQPPVPPAPVAQWPAPQPKPTKEKEGRKRLSPPSQGKKVATVVLCVFMVLFLVSSSLISIIRIIPTKPFLYAVLDDADFSELKFTNDNGETQTLAEAINQSVLYQTPDYIYDVGDAIGIVKLDDDDIDAIFDTDEVKEFIVDTILGYTDHFLHGDPLKTIRAADIADFVLEHQWLIFEETGKVVSFADRDIMIQEMERYFDFDTIADEEAINDTVGFDLSVISTIYSLLIYIPIVLAAICLIIILAINAKNLPACMTKVGVSAIVFGVWSLLLGSCMILAGTLFGSLEFIALIDAILSGLSSHFLIVGAVAFVIGLVLVLVRKLILKPRFE